MSAHPSSEEFYNMWLVFWRNAWQTLAGVWVTAFSMGQFIFLVQVYLEPFPKFLGFSIMCICSWCLLFFFSWCRQAWLIHDYEGMPLTHLPFLNSSYDVDLWSGWAQAVIKLVWQSRNTYIPAWWWEVPYLRRKMYIVIMELLLEPELLIRCSSFWFNWSGCWHLCIYWLLVAFSLLKAVDCSSLISYP